MRWGEVFPAPAMSHNIDLWLLYANTAQQAASGNYKKKQKKNIKANNSRDRNEEWFCYFLLKMSSETHLAELFL